MLLDLVLGDGEDDSASEAFNVNEVDITGKWVGVFDIVVVFIPEKIARSFRYYEKSLQKCV